MNRGVLSDQVQVLDLFLAMDAARCFGRGLQPRGFDGNTTVRAFAIGARLDACQCRINRRQFYQFPLAQGEFKFSLGCELGARVVRQSAPTTQYACPATVVGKGWCDSCS